MHRTGDAAGRAARRGPRPLTFALALLTLAVLTACSDTPPAPAVSRVEAVAAKKTDAAPEKWCDVSFADAEAPRLELPPVAPARPGEPLPSLPSDRWVWLNLWATWCGPCRQEMPLLGRWRDQLRKEGQDFDLWFMSLDEQEADLTRFLKENPQMAPGSSVRMTSMSDLEPWLKKYRLDATAAIPIQVLAAPGGKVRCVRVGSLRDNDYPKVKALLK
jgi:thiol-disulfide isomerase/thioredoxin